MYNGNRIMINGRWIPDDYIRNLSITKKEKIVHEYDDMFGNHHRTTIPKVHISFEIRPHLSSEGDIALLIPSDFNGVGVSYYDEYSGELVSKIFTMDEFTWKHHAIYGSQIVYEAAQISLEEQ